jgi:uncharacterized membrane protein
MNGVSTSWYGKRRWTMKFHAADWPVRHARCVDPFSVVRSVSKRSWLIGVLVLAASTSSEAREQAKTPPVVMEHVADPHWVQGQVTIAASPEVVWSALQKVDAWPQLLTDVERLEVRQHDGSHWEIELETRTLEHGMLGYHVELGPGRLVRFWRDGMGVAVSAFLRVRDGRTKDECNVIYTLAIHLSGIPRLLISDASLHEKQSHMVEVTLADLHRAFEGKR